MQTYNIYVLVNDYLKQIGRESLDINTTIYKRNINGVYLNVGEHLKMIDTTPMLTKHGGSTVQYSVHQVHVQLEISLPKLIANSSLSKI